MKKSDFNLQRLAKNNFLIWKKKKEEEQEEKKKRHEFRTRIENETLKTHGKPYTSNTQILTGPSRSHSDCVEGPRVSKVPRSSLVGGSIWGTRRTRDQSLNQLSKSRTSLRNRLTKATHRARSEELFLLAFVVIYTLCAGFFSYPT